MTKIAVVIANLFLLVGVRFFFEGDVQVNQSIPENAAAGETFTVEINIEKEDRAGFAKWQQELPDGFIASPLETEGATFSFKNQTVKLIWMALPENENFTFSYEIKTDPTLSGSFELNGKFSYIENNERKDINAEVRTIQIGDAMISSKDEFAKDSEKLISDATDTIENPEDKSEKISTELTTDEVIEEITTTEVTDKPTENLNQVNNEPSTRVERNGISIERKINYLDAGNYQVDLKINKGDINSFGKIEEYLPPGFEASPLENEKGRFSFDDNVMKILWMIMPKEPSIDISYTLTSTTDELDTAIIHGIFSYLEGSQSKQMEIKGTKFANTIMMEDSSEEEVIAEEVNEKIEEMMVEKINAEAIAETASELIIDSNTSKSNSSIENTIIETKSVEDQIATNDQLIKEITNVPSPENGINYKVQIAAGKKEVKPSYFQQVHNISENVDIEYHDSWYKYTVGLYDVYKDARNKRNSVWQENNKIDDAFVTAYNTGERISVQEALMISNQKWFK